MTFGIVTDRQKVMHKSSKRFGWKPESSNTYRNQKIVWKAAQTGKRIFLWQKTGKRLPITPPPPRYTVVAHMNGSSEFWICFKWVWLSRAPEYIVTQWPFTVRVKRRDVHIRCVLLNCSFPFWPSNFTFAYFSFRVFVYPIEKYEIQNREMGNCNLPPLHQMLGHFHAMD